MKKGTERAMRNVNTQTSEFDGYMSDGTDRFAIMIGGGSYVVADPAKPLAHGCPCVLQVAAGCWYTEATVATKHPMRTKTLRIIGEGGRIVRIANRADVARIVGRFIATRCVVQEGRR